MCCLACVVLLLSNRSQYVMVDVYRSRLLNVVSGVPQGGVFLPLFVPPVRFEVLFHYGNTLIAYADDSTLMAVVPSPGVRVTVAESQIRDLGKVSEWCNPIGIKWNASKTKTMKVSRSCIMHPQLPPLTIGKIMMKESDVDILGFIFDSKMTFQRHLRSGSRASSHGLGISKKSW